MLRDLHEQLLVLALMPFVAVGYIFILIGNAIMEGVKWVLGEVEGDDDQDIGPSI